MVEKNCRVCVSGEITKEPVRYEIEGKGYYEFGLFYEAERVTGERENVPFFVRVPESGRNIKGVEYFVEGDTVRVEGEVKPLQVGKGVRMGIFAETASLNSIQGDNHSWVKIQGTIEKRRLSGDGRIYGGRVTYGVNNAPVYLDIIGFGGVAGELSEIPENKVVEIEGRLNSLTHTDKQGKVRKSLEVCVKKINE